MSAAIETSNPEALTPLNEAYAQVMAYSLTSLRNGNLNPERLAKSAYEETSFGQVTVDS